MSSKVYKQVLVIPDPHFPYEHPDMLPFMRKIKRKYKPDLVVGTGDIVDNSSISFHAKGGELDSPAEEIRKSVLKLKQLVKIFPKMIITEGNHDVLLMRKAVEHALPSAAFRSLNEVFELPKTYQFVNDFKFNTPNGMVYLCHGKTSAPGKLSQLYGMNTLQGHYHTTFQCTYTSTPEKLLWDVVCGTLANPKSLALAYASNNAKRQILGAVVITNGIPQLIPMRLNKSGRWIGRL